MGKKVLVKKISRGVKKAVKGVKKIAKSDIGKAALLGAAALYYMPKYGIKGAWRFKTIFW